MKPDPKAKAKEMFAKFRQTQIAQFSAMAGALPHNVPPTQARDIAAQATGLRKRMTPIV